jgi:hypothetical protein
MMENAMVNLVRKIRAPPLCMSWERVMVIVEIIDNHTPVVAGTKPSYYGRQIVVAGTGTD